MEFLERFALIMGYISLTAGGFSLTLIISSYIIIKAIDFLVRAKKIGLYVFNYVKREDEFKQWLEEQYPESYKKAVKEHGK